MFYLRYLCWFAHSGAQHILCCVFVCFVLLCYVASFSGLSICYCPSIFSNVCFIFYTNSVGYLSVCLT